MFIFRVFLPSFEKERRKMLAKRRKKDRGRILTARRKFAQKARANFKVHEILPSCSRNTLRQEINYLRSLLLNLPLNLCEDFGLFPSGKALTAVSEKASRGDTNLCSNKLNSVAYLHSNQLEPSWRSTVRGTVRETTFSISRRRISEARGASSLLDSTISSSWI